MYIFNDIYIHYTECNYFNIWNLVTCTLYTGVLFMITATSTAFLHKFRLLEGSREAKGLDSTDNHFVTYQGLAGGFFSPPMNNIVTYFQREL